MDVDLAELLGPATPRTASRFAVATAVRFEINDIGRRLRRLREESGAEFDRLAAFLEVAATAGLRRNEIAELAGVSRQTILNIENDRRGSERRWSLDTRIVLELGVRGASSREQLAALLARGSVRREEVERAFTRLREAGTIEYAGTGISGTSAVDYFRLSAQGIAEVSERLRHEAVPPSRRWAAYVEVAPDDAEAIARAGESLLGEDAVAVIPVGTVFGMKAPEVAFHVEAGTAEQAVAAAAERFDELRRRAGLPVAGPAVVRALVPPAAASRDDR